MMDRSEVVVVSTDGAQHAPAKRGGPVPIEELDEFLAFIADARHSDVA